MWQVSWPHLKNGLGMHGMAFDAEIKGSTAGRIYYSDGSFESRKDLYAYYVQHPEIKVINNSLGNRVLFDEHQ